MDSFHIFSVANEQLNNLETIEFLHIDFFIIRELIYFETDIPLNKFFTCYSVACSTYSNTYLSIAMNVMNRSHALDLTVNLWILEDSPRMEFGVINRIW